MGLRIPRFKSYFNCNSFYFLSIIIIIILDRLIIIIIIIIIFGIIKLIF